jgi:hypothetical protein
VLDQRGLRRDGINRNDVGTRQTHANRGGLVAFADGGARRVDSDTQLPTSSIMRIALCGHSCAQTPHPLQTAKSTSNQRGFSTTHWTGQKSQHSPHLTQLTRSKTGRTLRQFPGNILLSTVAMGAKSSGIDDASK